MKIQQITFLKSAPSNKDLIIDKVPEICVLGRSNVGKSSLINFICQRKKIAKVANRPGKTVLLNFFDVNNNFLRIVDTPGYGYAKTNQQVMINILQQTLTFLEKRNNLVLGCLLLDIRRVPNTRDMMMYHFLIKKCGLSVLLILTKIDKLNKNQINRQTNVILKTLEITQAQPYLLTSSVKKIGFSDFWEFVDNHLQKHKPNFKK